MGSLACSISYSRRILQPPAANSSQRSHLFDVSRAKFQAGDLDAVAGKSGLNSHTKERLDDGNHEKSKSFLQFNGISVTFKFESDTVICLKSEHQKQPSKAATPSKWQAWDAREAPLPWDLR